MPQPLHLFRPASSWVFAHARRWLLAGPALLALGASGCVGASSNGDLFPDGNNGGGGGSAGSAGTDGGGTGGSDTGDTRCGNGALDRGELCDTAIAAGQEGACPASCDDGKGCTTDSLAGTACTQECVHGDITANANGDGCCLPTANATTDSDCPAVCGNRIAEPGETCDTAITAGESGACPTACDDGQVCSTDTLLKAGTCEAICTSTDITLPIDADGCCPPGANVGNDDDCGVACGDGVLGDGVTPAGESCDTAIPAGAPGACPAACDDGNTCSTDRLDYPGTCNAICDAVRITTPKNDDGCCPPGASIGNDNDCTAKCGDGVKTGSENCDTAIPSGAPGSCPASCSDGKPCTTDSLLNPGTCNAACAYAPITTPQNGDTCCPAGADAGNDSDCPVRCGDGVKSQGEACDTAIASGAGSCPTACDDNQVCTNDVLANPGTCDALCTTTPKSPNRATPDQCCPAGASLASDIDCAPKCSDTVITPPETCDDGNLTNGDGCSALCRAEPVAYRFSDLDVKDPHMFANILGCTDLTDLNMLGQKGVNPKLQDAINGDSQPDGVLDLSMAHVFLPLDQTPGRSTPSYTVLPDCTSPNACTLPAGAHKTPGDAFNRAAGKCVEIEPGSVQNPTNGTNNGIVEPTAAAGSPCYSANVNVITLALSGITLVLDHAVIGGEWVGSPATEIRDGLIKGFMTRANADATIIPDKLTGIATVDNHPVSSLLRGGAGACKGGSDVDRVNGVEGWWFYLNFKALRVASYTER